MKKLVTENERKLLFKHFRQVVKNDPLLSTFPRRDREVFAERMTEIEKARLQEEESSLTFPPEGYEVTLFPKANSSRHPLQPSDTGVQVHGTTPSERASAL